GLMVKRRKTQWLSASHCFTTGETRIPGLRLTAGDRSGVMPARATPRRMAEPLKLTRVPSLKTPADFRHHVASLGIELPCDDEILVATPPHWHNRFPVSRSTASASAIAGPSSRWKAGTARVAAAPRTRCGGDGSASARAAPN